MPKAKTPVTEPEDMTPETEENTPKTEENAPETKLQTKTVSFPGGVVRLREGPGVYEETITTIPDGTTVTVTGLPVENDGRSWTPVNGGWMMSQYLK